MEIGPLDGELNERPDSWTRHYHTLFIDNPVGTGFSFVENNRLLATNNTQIAKDLVQCLDQILAQLPDKFRSAPIHIMSESYGGKMAAEFGLELYKSIKSGKVDANLAGVGLGDSWIAPTDSVMTWAPYLLALGAVDNDGYDQIMRSANKTLVAVKEGRWEEATTEWGRTESAVMSATHGIDFYNVLKKIDYYGMIGKKGKLVLPGVGKETISLDRIMNVRVKEALGLPSWAYWAQSSGQVFSTLAGDFMRPVTDVGRFAK